MSKPILNKKSTLFTRERILEFSVALVLILVGVSLRLLSHPPNFAPIAAIALFGGVYFRKKIALALPMTVMIVSDIFIGHYEVGLMIFVYGSFLVCVILGFWLKKHKKWYTVLGSSVVAAVAFFLLTNFAVWLFAPCYTKNIFGILQCYLMALPFFRNTLLGNLFYVSAFFGAYEMVRSLVVLKKPITGLFNFGFEKLK